MARAECVRAGRGRFCSRKCAAIVRVRSHPTPRVRLTGARNGQWKGGAPRRRPKSPQERAQKAKYRRAWQAANRQKIYAHQAVYRAIRSGRLVRQPCSRCGAEPAEAHHEDYARRLDVEWLCPECHRQRHDEYGWYQI
jgi:ribosomal protein S27AE